MMHRPLPALIATLVVAAPSLAAEATPAARLASYNDAVVAIMKARQPLAARVTRFETLVKAYYDMPGLTALVVGPKWASASPEDKAAAIAALTRHSAVSLAKNFADYDGERFTTDPNALPRGNSSIVKVTIAGKSVSAVLQYRLRQVGGEWRIFDVIADGISQTALQRAELAGTIAADGIAGMTKKLAEKDKI